MNTYKIDRKRTSDNSHLVYLIRSKSGYGWTDDCVITKTNQLRQWFEIAKKSLDNEIDSK